MLKRFLFVLIASLTVTSCSQQHVVIDVDRSDEANVAADSRPLPLQLYFYQLRDESSWQGASFRQLWQQDETTLGISLLSKQAITLMPQQQKRLRLRRDPQAHYLGVFALMRQHQHLAWQSYVPLAENHFLTQHFKLTVDGSGLAIKEASWWQQEG